MAIEFRCTKCQKLLRTAEGTSGKHAKCPECGEILLIPEVHVEAEAIEPTVPPSSSSTGDRAPFAPQSPYPSANDSFSASSGTWSGPKYPPSSGGFQPVPLEWNDVMSRTWTIFKQEWVACLAGCWIVAFINGIATQLVSAIVNRLFHIESRFEKMSLQQVLEYFQDHSTSFMLAGILSNILTLVLMAWLNAGLCIYLLKIARGQKATINDIFSGGKFYAVMLPASVIHLFALQIGFALLIVPGILLALMLSQFAYLIVDRQLGVIESLKTSIAITNGNKLTLFVIWLVCIGIGVLAILPCFLGLIVALPYFTLLNAFIYLTLTGQPTIDQVRNQS